MADADTPLLRKPPLRRAFDAILERCTGLIRRNRSISAEQLLDAARKKTGWSDFGEPEFFSELRILLETLRDAPLTAPGRRGFDEVIRLALVRRLWLRHIFERDPSLTTAPIRTPFVIIGFPRSGTTLLHNLLGLAPGCRWLRAWEIEPPFPSATSWGTHRDRRLREYERSMAIIRKRNPPVHQLHAADSPEECWRLFLPSFHCHTLFFFFGFERYKHWLDTSAADASTRAYVLHRVQLQLFQQRAGGSHWVLKSPEHTIELPTLLTTYPDARVIHLHRDPYEVVGSYCNLVEAVQANIVRGITGRELGRQVTHSLASWADRIITIRHSLPKANVCDVAYSDLVSNPVETVRRIHEHFGAIISPEFSDRLMNWQHSQIPGHHRGAVHHFDRFALERVEIDQLFERYRNRFASCVGRARCLETKSA
jgi:hypothetical protein